MRRWWPVVPLGAGALVTAFVLVRGERRTLDVSVGLGWVPLQVGLVVAVALAAALRVRASRRAAVAAAERRVVAAERAERRRFVERLDHELKNPVTAIRLGLSNLPDDEVTASLEAQTLRLSGVLTDLRKLSELERAALEVEPVDLEALAREVAETVGDLAGDRDVTVAFPRAPRPVPPVAGDTDMLFLAVHNLVTNAVKFSAPGARIELRGSEDDGWATLEVADTGRGIAADEHALVWEELARGRDAHGVPGSGLGLPFVRTVVERHGGTVALRSREGEGTAVRLRLPLGPAR